MTAHAAAVEQAHAAGGTIGASVDATLAAWAPSPQVLADLAHVVEVVQHADPGLRSLVLTGAFSRGEGALVGGRPQNDYDLVAIRGLRPSKVPYARLRQGLQRDLGLHFDLAPVSAWRLPFVAKSIFWYETALRGRTLWGKEMRGRIPVRDSQDLGRSEGLRLLVNRSAGLLLATAMKDPHGVRIQAAKAILAALDAQLLAAGSFAPSHRERWDALLRLRAAGRAPPGLAGDLGWMEWALAYKLDPATAEPRGASMTWRAARRAVLDAVPVALRHAGMRSLDDYSRRDTFADRIVYHRRSAQVPGAKRWAWNPTGRVRLATLRLLEATPTGELDPVIARRLLNGILPAQAEPLTGLEALRGATLQ